MIINIILCISILPVLLIMYVVLAGMGKEQNNILFGITLWQGAMKEERIQRLIADYKKQLKHWTLFFFLIQFPLYLIKYFSIMIILWMIWLFAVIIFLNVPYVKANKKMRAFKTAYQLEHGEEKQNHTYVDITAAVEEKPKYFVKSTIVACVAGFLPAVLAVILNKMVNSPSAPDLWVAEVVLLSMALVGVVCLWALHYYNHQPVTVFTTDSDVNVQISRVGKYQWSRCFSTFAWLAVIFNGLMLAGFYLDSKYMLGFVVILCSLYGIIPLVLVWASCRIIKKQKEKLLTGRELLLTEEDDNWIWGIFYYNKNDSRLWVDKKVGIGFTCNMAKPGAIIFNTVMIGVVLIVCFGAGIICALEEFTPVRLKYEKEQLMAVHWKEEYQIEKEDIKSVELLEELPSMSKVSGTGMDTVYKGKWFSREYDRRFRVCLNPEAEPIIMIETTDGTWYLLGDSEPEQTEEIYEELKK